MTTLALVVTLGSLVLAASMTCLVARLVRDDRRRSDARAAVLAEIAEEGFLSEPELHASPEAASGGLFVRPDRQQVRSRRLAIAGGIMTGILALAALMLMRATPPLDGSITGEHQAAAAPLALVALGHTQDAGRIVVSGRVQSPLGGPAPSSLTATVFLFGADGSFLTSGRSPLATGDSGESSFTVVIPVNGAVARYRVSFRDSAGHPVAHIDRRQTAALARNN